MFISVTLTSKKRKYMEKGRIFGANDLNRIAQRMQNGDQGAAQELYQKLVRKVFGFCMSRVSNRASAEDLTQDIFLKIIQKIELYDQKKSDFIVWFWQIARNAIIDHYRSKKNISFSDLENEGAIEDAETENIEDAFQNKSDFDKIVSFVKSLPEEEKEFFRLRYVADLSYKEIAGIVDKSEGALRVQASRLKKKIEDNFKKYV